MPDSPEPPVCVHAGHAAAGRFASGSRGGLGRGGAARGFVRAARRGLVAAGRLQPARREPGGCLGRVECVVGRAGRGFDAGFGRRARFGRAGRFGFVGHHGLVFAGPQARRPDARGIPQLA
ncbi:hypothetical protein BGLA2_1680038 [Burkholderia gladioli]|nr:hypothetical protein BGLA2_1680038 [Burkholderia gladioli]